MSKDPVTPPKMNGVAALDTQSEPKGPRRKRIRGKTSEAGTAAYGAMGDSIAPEDSLSPLFVGEKGVFASPMFVDAAVEAEHRGRLLQAVEQAAENLPRPEKVVPAETGEGSEAETSPAASFNYLHPPHDDTIVEVRKPDTIVEVGAPDTILEMEEPATFVEVNEPTPECEKLVINQATYN